MADGRRNNKGTKGNKGGRKPKADEQKLIERLDNIIDSDEVIKKMYDMIKQGNYQAVKLYLEYRFGKPKESIDVTTNGDNVGFGKITFINGDKDK